jgi:alcohol dehydrogenase
MNALVYHGPGERSWDEVPDPAIQQPTDAIVRITSSTICGTDLHILGGDVPEVKPDTILGHEAVGIVVEVGDAVTTLEPGDRVLVSCITSCGSCRFCKEARYGILPTSFEVGVLNGGVQPGDTVAIVGAGPVGLAAILTAKLYTPGRIVAIDLAEARLAKALELGADVAIDNGREDAVERVMQLTGGLGADVAIEAVGVPATFELCADLVRPGGRVANVGVHGHAATLHLERLWIRDVTIMTGLVDTFSTPRLLELIATGRLDATPFATHRFPLGETMAAYDTFAAAADTRALKVVLEGERVEVLPEDREEVAVGA